MENISFLLMVFTADGWLLSELLEKRGRNFKISTAEKRKQWEDIPITEAGTMDNAWGR